MRRVTKVSARGRWFKAVSSMVGIGVCAPFYEGEMPGLGGGVAMRDISTRFVLKQDTGNLAPGPLD